jgi:glycosyltransferase involved in cell wall biosynthesis
MSLRDQLAGYSAGDAGLLDEAGALRDAEPKAPSAAELDQHAVAPGRSAVLPVGVMYQGEWRTLADGICKHVREQSRALAMHLPVTLSAVGPGPLLDHEIDASVIEAVGYLQNVHCSRYPCAVRHIVFLTTEYLRNVVCPGGGRLSGADDEERVWRSTIVYTSWERDRVAQIFVDDLLRLGEVWVPCEANRRAFVSSGMPPAKVRSIPYPYDPSTHLASKIPIPRGNELVPSGRRFYSIGKWEPRKDHHSLIGAFLLAFTPRDRACLTLKTFGWGQWHGHPTPQESAKHWVGDPAVQANGWTRRSINRLVRVIDAELTDEEIAGLHRENNIYISASHGEAWDIPAFDARCAGNSLVYVGYGGAEEYTVPDGERFVQVPYKMGPVHPGYGWEQGAQWADYRLEDLVASLRKARPPERRVHPVDFAGRFGRAAVGAKMARAVLDMLGRHDVGLADELRSAGGFG